jgi:hypothetical protein
MSTVMVVSSSEGQSSWTKPFVGTVKVSVLVSVDEVGVVGESDVGVGEGEGEASGSSELAAAESSRHWLGRC